MTNSMFTQIGKVTYLQHLLEKLKSKCRTGVNRIYEVAVNMFIYFFKMELFQTRFLNIYVWWKKRLFY